MMYGDFESILVPENNGKQNTMSLKQINIKVMLTAVLITNLCVLMISLTCILSQI